MVQSESNAVYIEDAYLRNRGLMEYSMIHSKQTKHIRWENVHEKTNFDLVRNHIFSIIHCRLRWSGGGFAKRRDHPFSRF